MINENFQFCDCPECFKQVDYIWNVSNKSTIFGIFQTSRLYSECFKQVDYIWNISTKSTIFGIFQTSRLYSEYFKQVDYIRNISNKSTIFGKSNMIPLVDVNVPPNFD